MEKKSPQNKERHFVKIIKEICAEQNIVCTSFSYDWIFRLCKNDRLAFIFGYNFGINISTSAKICDDKCAASEILLNAGIPAVEHIFFMSPSNIHYVGENGNWSRLTELLKKHGKIVCKVNVGAGGNSVYLVENQFQLEEATHRIFKQTRAMAVSPYYEIKKEYRAIVIDGEVKLLYSKNIPSVIGDGKATIHTLLLEYMEKTHCFIDNVDFGDDTLLAILPEGEEYRIGWKSNLGKGAIPQILSDGDKKNKLTKLAISAAKALSIKFASVDMIETGDETRILEVNCGIMMEHFIPAATENYMIAKEIYQQAVHMMLEG
jgi:glutathione synthase/RimK-type ligase-like ATP-grasp enzyme